jgi:hypothetical protein
MPSILNAVGNAVAGLATIGGVAEVDSNGRPSLTKGSLAAPSTIISNLAIPGIPLISFRDYFLTTLESWVTTIPLRTQYIALFDSFPVDLNTQILQALEPIQGDKKGFNIDLAKKALVNYPLQSVVGCIFLDGVNIPTENLAVGNAPIENNRGFIQGSILENRDAFSGNNLTLQFRETNLSFTDIIMRSWVILASHRGFVATKDPSRSIKTNITIIQYSRTFQNVSQIPRKIWKYYDCVPLSVGTRNLTYDTEIVETYDVPFIYDRYTIENNLYIPLPDIISKIGRGSIPRISPFQK